MGVGLTRWPFATPCRAPVGVPVPQTRQSSEAEAGLPTVRRCLASVEEHGQTNQPRYSPLSALDGASVEWRLGTINGVTPGFASFWLAPDLPGSIYYQLKLPSLVIFRKEVAVGNGSKTALRAYRKLIEGQVLGCFIKPSPKVVLVFQLAVFCGHQTKHHRLATGNVLEGSKPARTVAIEL